MAGKKNPNLGDKLRQEREGAENTLRDSRSKTQTSSTGDGGKKKRNRRQIRHEADLAKMLVKRKSEPEVKAKKNAAASGKRQEAKEAGKFCGRCTFSQRHQSVRNADQIIILVWRQRILPKSSVEGVQPVLVPRFQYGKAAAVPKSWSGWRKGK